MRCAVLNCPNKFKSRQRHSVFVSFFSFPKNPDVLKKWIAFCRRNNKDRLKLDHHKSVICNEHFKDDDVHGGLQFQMGLCSKRTLRQGAVPCININNISEAERERTEKRENKKLVAELLKESDLREAAEASGKVTAAPSIVKNSGIVSVPDFVSATGNAFTPCTPTPSESDPLAEEQGDIEILTKSSDEKLPDKKCRTCCRLFAMDEHAKDLSEDQNAVMLFHIEVITGIWIQGNNERSTFMCSNCVNDLRTAIDFREICIKTELQLANEQHLSLSAVINENDLDVSITSDIVQQEINDDSITEVFVPVYETEREHIAQTVGTIKADPNSVALGAQIYEDLLNEYKGKGKVHRPKAKRVAKPVPKPVRQRIRPPREPKPMRPKRTKEEKNRIRREQIRAMPLNHVCDQCGASFRVRCNLKIHMLRHTRTKNFPCPECPKEFYDAYMRNIHFRVRHKGELPFACNYCSKSFSSSNTRYLHEKKVHEARPRIFRSINILNKRIELDDNLQPVQKKNTRHFCSYCDKSYATKYALNWHINVHLGLTPFKCKLCDMKFPDPQSKNKHELKHDNKRPFECDICLKGFYSRSKLKEHGRIHTGERPYRCDICDAYFRYKFNLYSHQFSKMHKENIKKLETDDIIEELN